ncbi:DUF305 domain-containing protein [Halovulum dunhuangense]|uniref:DUF305 domain-containing protein n=1 Tax=Halovulum dunhuangense TaxID=1505036 RepID=A0A849L0N8_9RHOB|nr:DUF305 domain-containing protein [Halovulum dunhuangense]
MKNRTFRITATALVSLAALGAQAQDHSGHAMGAMDHSGHAMEAAPNPATQALIEANNRMHADMTTDLTGDPDVDFAQGMIPHHQGAIDMARIVLEYGEDAELKALAQEIIAAQEEEIAFLRAWLEANAQ